ncbi:MAG: glycosyltransferase family 4 protein [Thermoanaerobaculia bacterium]
MRSGSFSISSDALAQVGQVVDGAGDVDSARALGILFLTQTYPRHAHDSSGPFIRDLARALVRGGDRVRVLAPHTRGLSASWQEDGVEVRTFRYAPERWELLGYGRSLHADERMSTGSAAVAPLYLLGARRALKATLREPGWNVVQAHWVVPNLPAAVFSAARLPLLVGLHGSDVFLAEKWPLRPWIRHALRRVDGLTSCSPELARRIQEIGFPTGSSAVIPYGVDSELFRPDEARKTIWRERLGIPLAAPLLLSVGRMATKKGLHLLIDALPELFAHLPEAHVVLAGGGDRLEEFRRRTVEFGGRVHLPGPVMHDTLPDLYRAADLFVLPAIHDPKGNVDGLPNVILEAMASALPVVGSRVSGLPLAVREGETGWLVAEGSVDDLRRVVPRALGDVARRLACGATARKVACAEFSWDSVAARYRASYVAASARWASRRARS